MSFLEFGWIWTNTQHFLAIAILALQEQQEVAVQQATILETLVRQNETLSEEVDLL